MLKFQETVKHVSGSAPISTCSETLIARRYVLQQKLGRGSFGTVYLVSDKKGKQGEELKVLKEISVGDLKPNETVEANLEAQLLSKLNHPAIVKFYSSFVERESFCIITEYCEGRDLDCKIQEYKESGKIFTENEIIEWFIQLLLGVNYMHERRILHRDLKTKNIFLKNNLLKIGDFGVSRLLMGSCDLATTFIGTPYYMSPEALKHQGYNTKSDIWSLGCILYEMCCMDHAFTGHNFLSIVLKIVEGNTPTLPDRYPSKLNTVLHSMLNKNPSLRPSAAEILKIPYIDEQLENVKCKFTNVALKDKTFNCQKEAAHIINANLSTINSYFILEIPEDPQIAEEYYNDVFDSCSETSEEEEKGEEEEENMEVSQTVSKTNLQVGIRCFLLHVLICKIDELVNNLYVTFVCRSAIQKLGAEVFEKVYHYLKKAREQNASEDEIQECLEKVVSRASDCFEVDQLLYFEEQLHALAEDAPV
uniref:Serine/threonine-protein kinase Nek11 n=1 Tax=Pelusios castaneus TaxID=367368 RepID=A0A8C8RPW8_9SAUR